MRKLSQSLIVLAVLVGCATPALAGVATKAPVASYALGKAKTCKVNYHKKTLTKTEKIIVKVKGKSKVETKSVRYVGCVYTAPKTTTKTTIPAKVPGGSGGIPAAKSDPPTSVTVIPSENPALVGDMVTYTITVASVAIPQTTGKIEVSDNGQQVDGCFPIQNPTYNADGTFSGTCSMTYSQAETDTIVGVFTGDSVFAQSAGSMTETVLTVLPTPPSTGGGGLGSGGGGSGSGDGGGGGTSPSPVIALSISVGSPVQDNVDYLSNTYTAIAGTTSNGAPTSTESGTVTFYSDSVPTCTMAVGGSTSTANCTIEYGTFGSHALSVGYADGLGDTATTSAQSEDIEPPAITNNDTWGVSPPTNNPTATVSVIGSSASVVLTDSSFEGATSVTLTDQLADSCTATVTTTTATCSMTVTGTPNSLSVSYPGGTTTVGTQSVSPNGTQSITTTWGNSTATVSGAQLSVTVSGATLNWSNWVVQSGLSGSSNPPNPLSAGVGKYVHLFVTTTGTASPDTSTCDTGQSLGNQEPCGYLVFTITGGDPSDYTTINEDAGSSDCSMVQNFSGQAEGGCSITFTDPGSYDISVEYIADGADSNYSDTTMSGTEQVNVS